MSQECAYEGKYGRASPHAGGLHHREPRHRAKKYGVSKSTVHKDLQDRLPQFDRCLYLQVKEVLDENKAQRHIRGGLATRKKYKGV